MPQARSRGTGSKSHAKPKPAAAAKSAAAKSAATKPKPAAKSKPAAASKTSRVSSARAEAGAARAKATKAADARAEAVAARLRKLNERIIEAGKEAGETTLSSYEKALKAIASSIESGPGKSEVEWISHLATTQAKFIRDVTKSWTDAARGVLK